MDIFLDATNTKRLDINTEFRVSTMELKQRRFVVKHGLTTRAFEFLLDAIDYYKSIDNTHDENRMIEELKNRGV